MRAGEAAYCMVFGLTPGSHIDPEIVDSYVMEHIEALAGIMKELSGEKNRL